MLLPGPWRCPSNRNAAPTVPRLGGMGLAGSPPLCCQPQTGRQRPGTGSPLASGSPSQRKGLLFTGAEGVGRGECTLSALADGEQAGSQVGWRLRCSAVSTLSSATQASSMTHPASSSGDERLCKGMPCACLCHAVASSQHGWYCMAWPGSLCYCEHSLNVPALAVACSAALGPAGTCSGVSQDVLCPAWVWVGTAGQAGVGPPSTPALVAWGRQAD